MPQKLFEGRAIVSYKKIDVGNKVCCAGGRHFYEDTDELTNTISDFVSDKSSQMATNCR